MLAVASCKRPLSPEDRTIAGTIEGTAGHYIFLEELTVDDLTRVDSSVVDENDKFSLSYSPTEAGIFLLKLTNGEFVTLILHKNDHIEILANSPDFTESYKIKGSEDSKILEEYFTKTFDNQVQLDSLSRVFRNSTHLNNFYQIKMGVDSAFAKLLSEQQQIAKQLIEENPFSLASVLLINQRFGSKKLFIKEDNLEMMLLLDSCLMRAYRNNSHVLAHHQRVQKILTKH